jgi:hypothetical protein
MTTGDGGNNYNKNVFINCPFDKKYINLLYPLLFTVLYLGYNPRIASERSDYSESRISKICELIEASKISIHDLSRISSEKEEDIYRMNMPFELGIDIGCRLIKGADATDKKCLILEEKPHSYLKALSNIAGADIKHHKNRSRDIVEVVRNWFVENEINQADSASRIWARFNEFNADFYVKRKYEGFEDRDIDSMPTKEFIHNTRLWLDGKNSIIE